MAEGATVATDSDAPRSPDNVAQAMRHHLEQMGAVTELEPGVLEVVTRAGRRWRWIRGMGGVYRFVSGTEPDSDAVRGLSLVDHHAGHHAGPHEDDAP